MKKDAYWFKHDSTSGRGLRMRKMAHIYGHWGKGVYWDVIEILRDQSNYCFDSDDSSLQMLSDLIGCKDDAKFITWFRDCVRLELFILQENKFLSEILCENMHNWETKKDNGNKGGRPKATETITETKPKHKPNPKLIETIREEKSIEEERIEEKNKIDFSIFWNLYDKKVASVKCKPKWDKLEITEQQKIIDTLPNFLNSIKDKQYQPNPETYLNQKRWEDDLSTVKSASSTKMVVFSNALGKFTASKTDEEIQKMKNNDYFTILEIDGNKSN